MKALITTGVALIALAIPTAASANVVIPALEKTNATKALIQGYGSKITCQYALARTALACVTNDLLVGFSIERKTTCKIIIKAYRFKASGTPVLFETRNGNICRTGYAA